jgi:hypothetical protein
MQPLVAFIKRCGNCLYMYGRLALLVVLSGGCTQNMADGNLHVVASDFHSQKVDREVKYYVAYFSTYPTNHFYVGATKLDQKQLVEALVYWKEPQIIMRYGELVDDAPEGAEIFAWQGPHLKLGRDTVAMPADIAGSTYLETHRQWLDWMDQCISKGKPFVITLNDATNLFPNTNRANADNE